MATRDKTTQEIADLFDVSTSTLSKWIKRGCPVDLAATRKQSHKFDAAEVAAWMKSNGVTGDMGRPPEPLSDELKELKIRKELALVLRYERENAVEDGKLIDAVTEQSRDIAKIMAVRNRLSGLGASIAPQLVGLDSGAEAQTIIDNEVAAILKQFSEER